MIMENWQTLHLATFPFFDMTPDLVCIAGKDGFFKKVNQSFISKLEYPEEELFGRPITSFIHPEDKELTKQERIKLLNGQALINFRNRYLRKDGEIIWLEWTSIYFPDKEIVFAIAKDVTERTQNEKEIEEKYKKFQSLATHFKSRIEKDRKYLALELHEELAQLASVAKIEIDWLNENIPGVSEAAKKKIEHASAITELLINTIRKISFALSPNMLEDIGLNETLKWLCNEFAVLNGIPCVFESTCEEISLSREIKLDFFRICQESLSNIMYHACANNVKIKMEDIGNKIYLSIKDDGKGFEVDQQKQVAGLTGIRETVSSINGQLIINSAIGKGTTVSVIIAKL